METKMAKIAKEHWEKLDVATLPEQLQDRFESSKMAYKRYQDAAKALPEYQEHLDAREEFENEMQKLFAPKLAEGKELKFGYLYGGLSIAIGDKPKSRAMVMPREGLAAWLKSMRENGERS
jgi:hypothetical protein